MKIKSAHIRDFKRFADLTVDGIPETTKLVVLLGPNGSGKTSLFDAFSSWAAISKTGGHNFDAEYHARSPTADTDQSQANNIEIEFYNVKPQKGKRDAEAKRSFYFRTAYRNEPDFATTNIQSVGDVLDDRHHPRTMIQGDQRVSENYQRIVSNTLSAIYDSSHDKLTVKDIREELIGKLRESMKRVFCDLILTGIGDPMSKGTFRFEKGAIKDFRYKNLSGGEKSAFDLLLDMTLKTKEFNNTIFCIDEPDLHMHTSLQSNLLKEMFALVPPSCQLWIATHSIGMMRMARDLHKLNPSEVVFLDFGNRNLDGSLTIRPTVITRSFWQKTFEYALGDLAYLVAPEMIVFCEGGRTELGSRRNTSFDAKCYNAIFEKEFSQVVFISLGGSEQLEKHSLLVSSVIKEMFMNVPYKTLRDRDDKSDTEIQKDRDRGFRSLSYREIENYLLGDEMLKKLCSVNGKTDNILDVLNVKKDLLANSVSEGRKADDVKLISGNLISKTASILGINYYDTNTFILSNLIPLITPDTQTYQEMKKDIFS